MCQNPQISFGAQIDDLNRFSDGSNGAEFDSETNS